MGLVKQLMFVVAGAIFSSAVFAAEDINKFNSTNFYMGFEGGLDSTSFDVNSTYWASAKSSSASGGSYGPYVGALVVPDSWRGFNTALEMFFNWNDTKSTYSSTNNLLSIEKQNTVGVSLLPGYFLKNWVNIYGRIGYVISQVETNNTFGAGYSNRNNLDGLQLGFGAVFNIWKNLSLRAELDWTNYGSVNQQQLESPFNTQNVSMNSFDGMLGVQWSF